MKGIVRIYTRDSSGRLKLHEVGNNILTDGLGISLTNLFTSTNRTIDDHKISYFQLGTSSHSYDSLPIPNQNNFYSLASALDLSSYGEDSRLRIQTLNAITVTNPFSAEKELSYTTESGAFCFIRDSQISTFADENNIFIQVVLDRNTAQGEVIKELGLYVKNPEYSTTKDQPALLAYKVLDTALTKQDFEVIISWQIALGEESESSENGITWYPSVQNNKNIFFSHFMDEGESYTANLILIGGSPTDTVVTLEVTGNGTSGIEWDIDTGLQIPITAGDNVIPITISGLECDSYFGEREVSIRIASAPGLNIMSTPDYTDTFKVFIKSTKTPPTVAWSSQINNISVGATFELSAVLDGSCLDDSYIYLSSNAVAGSPVFEFEAPYIRIPASSTVGKVDFSSISTAGTVDILIRNDYNTDRVNYYTYSNNFNHDGTVEYIEGIPASGPLELKRVKYPGWPSDHSWSGFDDAEPQPAYEYFCEIVSATGELEPDGLAAPILAFMPSSIYYSDNSAGKIRKSYNAASVYDSLGRSTSGADQTYPFNQDSSGLWQTFSLYVKSPSGTYDYNGINVVSSLYFTMAIYNRSGVEAYRATFNMSTNPPSLATSANFSSTDVVGVQTNAIYTDALVGNGWHRLYITKSTEADMVGDVSQRFIFPATTSNGSNLPGYTVAGAVPTDLSGTLIAWAQYEFGTDSNGFEPTPYVPVPRQWDEPYWTAKGPVLANQRAARIIIS